MRQERTLEMKKPRRGESRQGFGNVETREGNNVMKKGTTEHSPSHIGAAQIDPGAVIIRMSEVEKITGLKRATIYKYLAADSGFPKQIPLSDSKQRGAPVGWLLAEVQAWVRSRSALRGEAA